MADWRQIQARIRKAKNAPDAHAKLSELYQRTRDAMVAWELGLLEEKTLVQAEAVKWYTIAAQRFRRADWKKKAEEALARLGAEIPAAGAHAEPPNTEHSESFRTVEHEEPEAQPQLAVGEIPESEDNEEGTESASAETSSVAGPSVNGSPADGMKRKRRRGRRGGRGRRRKGPAGAQGLPSQAFAEPAAPPQSHSHQHSQSHHEVRQESQRGSHHESARPASVERPAIQLPDPQLPSERMAHGRAGDPALASRMAQLESRLRRLLSSALHRLDDADEAPAGPGVFLLSDSDQVTSYYIESCQTLRIGLGNLVRGGRSGKSGRGGHTASDSGLKAKLAEHLGINEAKVSQYMKDHCVVRWIQLDEEAPILAHFAISLLRPPLNLD